MMMEATQHFVWNGILCCALIAFAPVAVLAGDNAGNSAYNDGWQTGDNGGDEFGPWTLSSSGSGGHFIGSSAGNGDGDGNSDGDINTGGRAWGQWANSGGVSNAVRPLASAPLATGGKITLAMDNGWIDTGGTVGIGIQNSSGQNLVEFYFVGGQPDYKTNDSTGQHNTGIGFTDEGLNLEFELTSSTGYSLKITPIGGSTTTMTGTLINPGGGQGVAQIRTFNANAGSGSQRDAFFNSLDTVNSVVDWQTY